jgi:hypothetical protein
MIMIIWRFYFFVVPFSQHCIAFFISSVDKSMACEDHLDGRAPCRATVGTLIHQYQWTMGWMAFMGELIGVNAVATTSNNEP